MRDTTPDIEAVTGPYGIKITDPHGGQLVAPYAVVTLAALSR